MIWIGLQCDNRRCKISIMMLLYLKRCSIYILSCHWKLNNGMLMLRITGLNGLGEDLVKAEYVRVDYLYALDLYLIGTSIGVKKSQDSRNSQVAKQWRKWAVRFINAKKERIARLVRILGYDSLEEVFGYQVTIAMLRPLRFFKSCKAK